MDQKFPFSYITESWTFLFRQVLWEVQMGGPPGIIIKQYLHFQDRLLFIIIGGKRVDYLN